MTSTNDLFHARIAARQSECSIWIPLVLCVLLTQSTFMFVISVLSFMSKIYAYVEKLGKDDLISALGHINFLT